MRVTVTSDDRRIDLVLHGSVPVAELLPELSRRVGAVHPEGAPSAPRLRTAAGRELDPAAGLAAQGVEDGAVLWVDWVSDEPPPRYDDPAEALADIVRRDRRAWDDHWARRTSWALAAVFLLLGAGVLLGGVVSRLAEPVARGLTVTLVLVVLVAPGLPTVAVLAAPGLERGGPEVDPAQISRGLRRAQACLRVLTVATGLVLVALCLVAATLDLPGAIVAWLACLLVLLRAPRHHAREHVLAGVCTAALGVVTTSVAVAVLRPDLRALLGAVLVAAAGVVASVAALRRPATLHIRRLCDLAETAALVALLPALALAVTPRSWVG